MTSQMNTKVRLVRCPRCRQLLPELPDVPLYKCGGCDITLQAKNKKRDTQDIGSLVREGDLIKENGLDHVRDLSTDESDSEKIPERCESNIDCRKESVGLNQSLEYHCSDVISCHENTESSPESNGHAGGEKDRFPLVQYGADYHTEARDDDSEHPGGTSGSNEIFLSPKLGLHEGQSLVQGSKTYDNESFTSSPVKEDESQGSLENHSDGGQYGSQNCKQELPISTSFSRDLSLSDEFTREIGLLAVSGKDRELNGSSDNHVLSRSLNPTALLETSADDQICKEQSSPVESDSPNNQMFSCSESFKQAQDGTHSAFQRVSSADSMENFRQVYARTDLGVTLRSSTAKNYYAYGVGTSSFKDTEDQLPSQQFQQSRRNIKDAEFSSTKRIPKRNELVTHSETKLPHRPMHSEALKKHHTTKGSKWNRDEFQEPTGPSHPLSSVMATKRGEYLSKPPLYSKASQPVYKNGGSSSYEQKSLPERNVNPESDKLELLRMVYELQDQLNRAHVSKGMPQERFPSTVTEKEQLPAYGNLFPPNRERYPDPGYHKYPERHDQDQSWLQRGTVHRSAFSGEFTHFRHEVDCSCLQCYRQKWHYSAQLPRHAGYNVGHTMAYPRDNRYSAYRFASSSSHQYIPSEVSSWNHDTKANDKHQSNYEVKRKQHPAKQQFRPIAGGSPIIACYCCNEILQLPADFLLFKRRCHRLRCGACSVVLKFSLKNQFNLVKYDSEPRTPPPSEVGDYIETKKFESTSSASGYQRGVPVSHSDNYGRAFSRSSTDVEQFTPVPPYGILNEISDHKKMSAGDPFQTKKEGKRKSIIHDSGDNYYSPGENFELAGPSSMMYKPENSFSEIEEVLPEGNANLHRLMGYPSPSRFVYQ